MLPLMRFFIVLFCFNCGDFVTRAAESGTLVIVGGGGTPLAVRQLFVKLAGGKTARIAVLPQASSRKDRGQSSVKMFSELGAKVFIVELKNQKTARAQLDEATAIWFPGGSQAALFDALEKATLVKPIRVRHARGLPIGGTSAGAASVWWRPGGCGTCALMPRRIRWCWSMTRRWSFTGKYQSVMAAAIF